MHRNALTIDNAILSVVSRIATAAFGHNRLLKVDARKQPLDRRLTLPAIRCVTLDIKKLSFHPMTTTTSWEDMPVAEAFA